MGSSGGLCEKEVDKEEQQKDAEEVDDEEEPKVEEK